MDEHWRPARGQALAGLRLPLSGRVATSAGKETTCSVQRTTLCGMSSASRAPSLRASLFILVIGLCSLLVACGDGDSNGSASGDSAAGGDGAAQGDGGDLLQQGLDVHAEGDLDQAESLYRRALEENDKNQYAYYNLALVEQTTGRPQDAEEHYRLALAIDPNLGSALYNLAILRTQAEAFDEAVELYERAISVEPDNAAAHLNLGFLQTQLGREDEALSHLGTALRLDPDLAGRLAEADSVTKQSGDGETATTTTEA